MSKTKEKILKTALKLYNSKGVSNVSIRHLAKEAGISHSNLIYHFSGQESIILDLHVLMLQRALELNSEINQSPVSLEKFYMGTKAGFMVVYDFRFLFNDLKYICFTFPEVKRVLLEIEAIRSGMYHSLISGLIAENLMREEDFESEYDQLITLIKIYSDHWLVSSNIYDSSSKQEKIEKYSKLLLTFFYPYLTDKGKNDCRKLVQINKH